MAQVTAAGMHSGVVTNVAVRRGNVARILNRIVFGSLLCLLVFAAIPYGTSQAWWKSLFVCVVFTLAIFWLVEGYLSDSWFGESWSLTLPLWLLAIFSFIQTIPFRSQAGNIAGISLPTRTAISADPYQTRFFALELMALIITGVLFSRFASSERRMRLTINVIIAVAVGTAIFGIVRQTAHPSVLFGLPFLPADLGYGQFINRNHFAFLMEMGLGLILGLLLGGGVKRDKALIYFAALLPLWIALVLCGSRGGLVAMLAQVVTAALLFGVVARRSSRDSQSRLSRVANSLPVKAALIIVLVLGVGVGTIWLGGDRLAIRIDQSREQLTSDVDALRYGVSRQEIWKASWKLFTAHPVLGVGMGAYWAAIPSVHDASGSMIPREAHNDYLELLASGGLIATALAIWFVFEVLRRTRRNLYSQHRFRRAACYGAAVGMTGVAVHSLLDFGLHMLANALVFTTLIVIATSKPQWANERATVYEPVS